MEGDDGVDAVDVVGRDVGVVVGVVAVAVEASLLQLKEKHNFLGGWEVRRHAKYREVNKMGNAGLMLLYILLCDSCDFL